MVQAIVAEARLRAPHFLGLAKGRVQTFYLGGGTPSLLPPESIKTLVSGVSEALNLDVTSLGEVTLEANPEDLSAECINAWL